MDSDKLTLKDLVHIATLSDLGAACSKGSAMLKLDVVPGKYTLQEYRDGYLLVTNGYTPNLKHGVKIFNCQDGDKGLSGTYYSGAIKDEKQMHIFNNWLRFYLHEESLSWLTYMQMLSHKELDWKSLKSEMGSNVRAGEDAPMKFDELPIFHNLPVLFYLNRCINDNDLSRISLKFPIMKKCGNVSVFWRVVHEQYGDIGIAILQKELHAMIGGVAGVAFFATKSGNAFGNFTYNGWKQPRNIVDYYATSYTRSVYRCIRTPCNCDWRG